MHDQLFFYVQVQYPKKAFNLNENKIKQMNVAGSGLLVGTALSVIIPEGVSALYSQKHHDGKLHAFQYPGLYFRT